MVEINKKDYNNILKFLGLFEDILKDILEENKINWAKKKTIQGILTSLSKFKYDLEEKKNV